MPASPIPPWLPGLVFTDPLTFPPMYRFDLVPGPGAFSKTVVLQDRGPGSTRPAARQRLDL